MIMADLSAASIPEGGWTGIFWNNLHLISGFAALLRDGKLMKVVGCAAVGKAGRLFLLRLENHLFPSSCYTAEKRQHHPFFCDIVARSRSRQQHICPLILFTRPKSMSISISVRTSISFPDREAA